MWLQFHLIFVIIQFGDNLHHKLFAEIAQSVEHFTRNEGVEGSSPFFSLKPQTLIIRGSAVFYF